MSRATDLQFRRPDDIVDVLLKPTVSLIYLLTLLMQTTRLGQALGFETEHVSEERSYPLK